MDGHKPRRKQLHPYFQVRTELTIHNDCILRGLRVVIPEKLRKDVLTEIHSSHLGIVRMKSIARLHVWWPHIDSDIESCTKECLPCQENHRNPNRAPPHLWEQALKPWERLHLDFAGPFQGHMWFILVDAFTKWPEVVQLSTTTAPKTITVSRIIFSRMGIPNQIVTHNGPQFTATEFQEQWYQSYPYCP